MRVRPWVIGLVLLVAGLVSHVVFEYWAAPYAFRHQMGQFAMLEALFFVVGLILVLDLVLASPTKKRDRWAVAWVMWIASVLVAAALVLHRLPS